ncbi:rod-binding protein [Roseivivax marinus]|uniref:rod-binding protein n=1 Tax=Roseivivax marinus TaxID=1379903 RepID=UPI0031404D7B
MHPLVMSHLKSNFTLAPRETHLKLQNTRKLAAEALETHFLSEMLRAAKFGEPRASFGGGAGEEQFASMLRDAHARTLTEHGGIGLTEHILRSLMENSHDQSLHASRQGTRGPTRP